MKKNSVSIKFWGTRGSRPVPGIDTTIYGGNTSCVEVCVENNLIIFDAGTGIANLGSYLVNKSIYKNIHIFITHYHWDHIIGLPYFSPIYNDDYNIHIYGEKKGNTSVKEVLKTLFSFPFHPINTEEIFSKVLFHDIKKDDIVNLENSISIKVFETIHNDGCLSFKLNYLDKNICYITDTENYKNSNINLLDYAQNSDILIYDSTYTQDEYIGALDNKPKKGWGHSTWENAVEFAKESNSKQLILFHHSTEHSDELLEKIQEKASYKFKNTILAKEGSRLYI